MTKKERIQEISILNLLFCWLVIWIHCSSHPISVLNHSSWQFGAIICLQRLAFVAVSGFFFLSGLKLTLQKSPPPPSDNFRFCAFRLFFFPFSFLA